MRDPIPPPTLFVSLTKPLAGKLSLSTLPYHAHEVVLAFLWYHFVLYVLSPVLSRALCPKVYNGFNRRTRLNWDIHWVSMVQALSINVAALYVIFNDEQRKEMDWRGRLWSYTPASGMVQGFAAGYFLWDLQISAQYMSVTGPSALVHAIGALAVTCIGFRPFANYYGLSFVLYELSTPFLNIHWFCDKLNLTGSRIQLYNGLALIFTFFACRLAWGTYQSVLIYSDIYMALTASSSSNLLGTMHDDGKCGGNVSGLSAEGSARCKDGTLPMWLVSIYLIGNTLLGLLNIYWFTLMIKAVKKRFATSSNRGKSADGKKSQ